jgi:hypothetical protein
MKSTTRQTLPIEELYFHTGNSGITARVLETCVRYDCWPQQSLEAQAQSPEDRPKGITPSYSYRIEFAHGAQGYRSTSSTPVISVEMIDNYIEMLQRVKYRMQSVGFDETSRSGQNATIHKKNGYDVREVWSPWVITDKHTSSQYLLGHHLLDCGRIVEFEPAEKIVGRNQASSHSNFKPSDVGTFTGNDSDEFEGCSEIINDDYLDGPVKWIYNQLVIEEIKRTASSRFDPDLGVNVGDGDATSKD